MYECVHSLSEQKKPITVPSLDLNILTVKIEYFSAYI